VRVSRFAGEYVEAGQDILEVLEDNSLEITLFVPQDRIGRWKKGEEVAVCVEPRTELLPCVVERIGDELKLAPPSMRRYYRGGERLVPVYLRPREAVVDENRFRLGSEVRLPYIL
jgi:hypothetical protein